MAPLSLEDHGHHSATGSVKGCAPVLAPILVILDVRMVFARTFRSDPGSMGNLAVGILTTESYVGQQSGKHLS